MVLAIGLATLMLLILIVIGGPGLRIMVASVGAGR